MAQSVTLNGKTYHKGDTVTFNGKAAGICYGPAGVKVKILYIRDGSIGLYSPDRRIDNWSDLDGEVESRRGWWIPPTELENCISSFDGHYEVTAKLENRGVNLEGKPCRMLAGLEDGTVFVEFEEDVNGCSADGLGRAGYCVAVNTKVLTKKKRVKHAQ
jgi:hypothetical protein